ncbi:methylenetetrahydrofolate reductase [Commensalibacter oyaizuii]|uniref:Methylenetetrahydrofolate reductase n=1 Tax=Commensalibacter oyaizuii TaxID=3043873 RepID=A0ABT6Q1P7_9PROT|nr:methylenetetrahydrofolate reductase [Commensalibacter sp. TBRC 16381]MDI2091039.1 methylenetetrahydrofolate reductase [Commensalibacter sp. TBRC 16381]
MTRISIELIPRDTDSLLTDIQTVNQFFPVADTINVPDLTRFPLRSWDAFKVCYPSYPKTIPHIRAIDVDPDHPLPGHDIPELQEVLIIQGDPPSDFHYRTYNNTTESILKRYQKELPHLTLYAAFDPYRRSPKEELEQIQCKKEAGAKGFFTQPIFDEKMLELCMDWLYGHNIFWGLSPVIGPKSKSYWEITNRVIFPHNFEPTLQANITFAKRALSLIKQVGNHSYLMPLRVKLEKYLPPLLEVF